MNNLKLKLKRLIGKYIGYWCEYCGELMEGYGYNFRTRCSDPDCFLNKIMDKPKRGRPKKSQ